MDQALAMLQRRGRVAYRTLKRQFTLDDEALEDLKTELVKAKRLAMDENGEVLVWAGGTTSPRVPAEEQTRAERGCRRSVPSSACCGDDPGMPPPKRLLIERTEGNPFFLEENVRTLIESGVLVGEGRAYRLSKPI